MIETNDPPWRNGKFRSQCNDSQVQRCRRAWTDCFVLEQMCFIRSHVLQSWASLGFLQCLSSAAKLSRMVASHFYEERHSDNNSGKLVNLAQRRQNTWSGFGQLNTQFRRWTWPATRIKLSRCFSLWLINMHLKIKSSDRLVTTTRQHTTTLLNQFWLFANDQFGFVPKSKNSHHTPRCIGIIFRAITFDGFNFSLAHMISLCHPHSATIYKRSSFFSADILKAPLKVIMTSSELSFKDAKLGLRNGINL